MSMAWEETHRRYNLVNAVVAEVARTGRPDVPANLAEEIDEVFGDFDAFLCDVRRRWYLTFDARLDDLLENPPPDIGRAVAELWHDLDRERPAIHALLDAYPGTTDVDAHHRDVLLTATGVDQFDLHARTRRVS